MSNESSPEEQPANIVEGYFGPRPLTTEHINLISKLAELDPSQAPTDMKKERDLFFNLPYEDKLRRLEILETEVKRLEEIKFRGFR